jgi:hypothetical protein
MSGFDGRARADFSRYENQYPTMAIAGNRQSIKEDKNRDALISAMTLRQCRAG